MGKTFAGTYLFGKYKEYEKEVFSFIMTANRLDKMGASFDSLEYDVKRRQTHKFISTILKSDKVILGVGNKPLSKSFKIFCAMDVKSSGKSHEKKIFIDCTDIITVSDQGSYSCSNVDILISYLISAAHTYIYYIDEKRLLNVSALTEAGVGCFSDLFTYIVDYVAKIGVMEDSRVSTIYLSSMYYLVNILGKDETSESIKHIARKHAGITPREGDIIDMKLKEEPYSDINSFVENLASILRMESKLTLDVILEKWIFVYGTSTIFALELFPSFATMITDTYVGAYINNQKSIEKITGRNMVAFSKNILDIGSSCI